MKKDNNNIHLSVVIPAYKEVDNLKKDVLEDVYSFLKKQKYSWEVIIVDDGSPDKTASEVKKCIKNMKGFRLMSEPHRGKGGTVTAGVLAATGSIILFTDMDQATPIGEVDKFLPLFKKGADIVIGTRSGRKGAPLSRKIMATGFTILRAVILRLPYRDTQCGFKAFTFDASRKVFSKMKVFSENNKAKGAAVTAGFDLEMLYLSRKLGLAVKEVPVVWRHRETKRVTPLKDSIEGLKDLLKVRMNALLGKYRI